MQRAWPILVAALCAGCLRSTQFRCDADADCGSGGRCQPAGFCSVADASCAGSMQRFGDSAGPLAGTCVDPGGGGGVDAGIDAPRPGEDCPGSYAPIANGTPGHRYRRLGPPKEWDEQVASCTEPGARTYLAIPDDASELAALVALNGSNKLWLGISDRETEEIFVNAKGVVQVFLPWKQGSPDQAEDNDKDCVAADSDRAIIDDKCDQKYEAVCECEE